MLLAEIMTNLVITITALIVLLLFFVGTAVCDIFKRHLLSKGAVYHITMLLAPLAAFAAVGVPLMFVLTQNPTWAKVLVFLGGIVLFIMTAVIYVRGNIFPTDKSSDYGGQTKLVGARRLIVLGTAGTVIYGVFTVIELVETINLIIILGDDPEKFFNHLLFLVVALLIPLINLMVLIYLIILGSQFLVFAAGVIMTMLQYVLIANGCIRYILTENRSKGEKALYIILALVPGVNIIMGIRYSVQISRILKEQKERSLKHGENEG